MTTIDTQTANIRAALTAAVTVFPVAASLVERIEDVLVDGLDADARIDRADDAITALRTTEDALRAVFGVWGPGRDAGTEARVAALTGPALTAIRGGVEELLKMAQCAEWGEEYEGSGCDALAKVTEFVATAKVLRG